jgi:hypothetical protein
MHISNAAANSENLISNALLIGEMSGESLCNLFHITSIKKIYAQEIMLHSASVKLHSASVETFITVLTDRLKLALSKCTFYRQ